SYFLSPMREKAAFAEYLSDTLFYRLFLLLHPICVNAHFAHSLGGHMTDEMKNDLDPRFNNTFYRGLQKQEREMSSRWGLHNNLFEKSRKMISRAEELLASATTNRKRDALDLFMQDERAVPPAPASAWDKFKQRL